MSEPRGFHTHQPLDTIRHHALAPRPEPVPEDVPTQNRRFANRVAPGRRTRGHPSAVQLGLESIEHDAAAFAERCSRAPQVVPTDAVENSIHTVTSETVDFLHEVT